MSTTRRVYGSVNTFAPVETYNEVLDRQGGRCVVTGRHITAHRPGVLMREDPTRGLDEDNLVVVCKFLLDSPDALSFPLLKEQWAVREKHTRSGTVRVAHRTLPY